MLLVTVRVTGPNEVSPNSWLIWSSLSRDREAAGASNRGCRASDDRPSRRQQRARCRTAPAATIAPCLIERTPLAKAAPTPTPAPTIRPFERAGDVARRMADEQAERIELEQLGRMPPTIRPPSAPPPLSGPPKRSGVPRRTMPKATPAPPIRATRIVRLSSTRRTDAAPMPGCSGCEAPRKP